MRKDIRVVIGANFGDEGKGLMTDYFCSMLSKNDKVLNIRYNGTCQAGHTVVKGKKRHVFSHFGAGSFNTNAVTFLTSDFYVNPILFNKEYDELVELGINPIIIVDPNAPVVTFYDMLYNRVIESSRGENRHGSCGMGLWEALLRGRADYILTVDDLKKGPRKLANKLLEIRNIYFAEKFKNDGIIFDSSVDDVDWFDESIIDNYILEAKKMLERIIIENEKSVLNRFNKVVFEGAQGLLLDWMNREYMPYLTASRTGLFNVNRLLKLIDSEYCVEVCYVTRSYFTRHGVGLFKTEVENKEKLGIFENDKTNHLNPWQGVFRYGYFDLDLFRNTIEKDLKDLESENIRKSICITHLDETNGYIMTENKISLTDFMALFAPNFDFYHSYSEDSKNVKYKTFADLRFLKDIYDD